MHLLAVATITCVLAAACGSTPTATIAPSNSTLPVRSVPLPRTVLATVVDPEAYCHTLDALPETEHGSRPGCSLAEPAWPPDDGKPSPARAIPAGPFAEARVISVIDKQGFEACALALRVGATWHVGTTQVTECRRDSRGYASVNGAIYAKHGQLVIEASEGHDPCGCDLWVSRHTMTVCGVGAGGTPWCSSPFFVEYTGAEHRRREWRLGPGELQLSAWHRGEEGRTDELVDAENGGGPAERYQIP